jgi:ATP-dependent helicase/nuclease subunit B
VGATFVVGSLTIVDTLVVYPTALKAESELRARARKHGCQLGHRVTTFPELTDALARDLGTPARVLDPELSAVVLARALERPGLPEALRAPRRGLLHELLRVIAELEAAYLAPDDVAAVAAGLPRGASAVRLDALARVYAAYLAGLARLGAVDRHGREWRVCEALAAAETARAIPPCLRGIRRIVFAEIYDFSVLQFLIATSLIRLIGDAELVAFAHEENVDATRFLDRTWNRFVGDPAIADQVLPSFVVRGGREGSLAAALRGVFAADRPPPVAGDDSIRVVVAPNRYREVEAAVRNIRRRLERGAPPERMAILARDLTAYGDLIEDVCRRYRVPVYFRKGKPLIANGLVKACLNVVRCVVEGFPRARLDAVLDSDYLPGAPARLVRTLRSIGFVGEAARLVTECIDHRLGALAAQARDTEQRDGRQAAIAREATRLEAARPVLVELLDTLRGLDGRRTPAGHVRVLRQTLRRLGFRPVPRGEDVPIAARRDARAAERFEETLAALAGVTRELGLEPMPLADFLRLVVAALEPLEVEDPVERTGSVRALSVLDARGLDFDTVYLVGLDDGTFPAPRAESPLWPDVMKREIGPLAAEVVRRKLGPRAEGLPLGGLLRTAREASLEDPFLFFLALSMAEREIVLSYPEMNESGNPTVPSPYLDEVRACLSTALPETKLDPTALVPLAEESCEVAELIGRAALERWSRRREAERDRLAPALADARPALAERLAAIDRRALIEERRSRYFLATRTSDHKEAFADGFVGRLTEGPGVLSARLAGMRWSPSRLEALGACGFRFFSHYMLGLDEDNDPETGVGYMESGTLVHAVLERFFTAYPRLPHDLAAARKLGRTYVADERPSIAHAIVAKDPALFDVTWAQIAAVVDELIVLEHAGRADGAGGDQSVEHILEKELQSPLVDPSGGLPLTLLGKPDRIDVRRRGGRVVGVRVLDYKMSRSPTKYMRLLDPERELGKTGFQIPVYLLGALATIGDVQPDAELEGGYVVLLADQKHYVRPLTREQLGPDGVGGRVLGLVAGARRGRFDVDPDPCHDFCAYRAICRYQRPPLEEDQ